MSNLLNLYDLKVKNKSVKPNKITYKTENNTLLWMDPLVSS